MLFDFRGGRRFVRGPGAAGPGGSGDVLGGAGVSDADGAGGSVGHGGGGGPGRGGRSGRRLTCEDVAAQLPGIVDGNDLADRRVSQHVETCLRCQAELVHYRKLLRALRQLRTEYLEPAPGLLTGILANLEEVGERGAIRSLLSGRRAAYIGGVAVAATAAGAAGTIVLVSRAANRRKGMRLAG